MVTTYDVTFSEAYCILSKIMDRLRICFCLIIAIVSSWKFASKFELLIYTKFSVA